MSNAPYVCRVSPAFRRAVVAWSEGAGLEYSAGLRQLLCLGLGWSLDDARNENTRQQIRSQQFADGLKANGLARRSPARRETLSAGDVAVIALRASPELARGTQGVRLGLDEYLAARPRGESRGSALRLLLLAGTQRTPEFLPGGPYQGATPVDETYVPQKRGPRKRLK